MWMLTFPSDVQKKMTHKIVQKGELFSVKTHTHTNLDCSQHEYVPQWTWKTENSWTRLSAKINKLNTINEKQKHNCCATKLIMWMALGKNMNCSLSKFFFFSSHFFCVSLPNSFFLTPQLLAFSEYKNNSCHVLSQPHWASTPYWKSYYFWS